MTITKKTANPAPTGPKNEYKVEFTPTEMSELKTMLGYKPAEFVPVTRLFNELAATLKAASAKAAGHDPQQGFSCDMSESQLQGLRSAAGAPEHEPADAVISKAMAKAKGAKLQLSRSAGGAAEISDARREELMKLAN